MMFFRILRKILFLFFLTTICYSLQAQKKRDLLLNRVIGVTETNEDFEDGQKPVKTEITKFDQTGEIIEITKYKNDGKFDSHFTYEYDSKGNKKKEISYNYKGQKEFWIDIEYNEEGNKFRESYVNVKGQKEKVIEYKYNNGLKSERLVLLPSGKVKSKKAYTYELHK